MADNKTSPTLNPTEMKLITALISHGAVQIDADWGEIAGAIGLKNGNVARITWANMKKKLAKVSEGDRSPTASKKRQSGEGNGGGAEKATSTKRLKETHADSASSDATAETDGGVKPGPES